jgi:hypothetical protein
MSISQSLSKVRRGRGPASARGVDYFARRRQALVPRPRSAARRPHFLVHNFLVIVCALQAIARRERSGSFVLQQQSLLVRGPRPRYSVRRPQPTTFCPHLLDHRPRPLVHRPCVYVSCPTRTPAADLSSARPGPSDLSHWPHTLGLWSALQSADIRF